MKYTLLEMVTSIMSDMDTDEITSISDTPETAQVASTIQDVFFQMVANNIIPELEEVGQLDTVSLVTYPAAKNYLQLPDTVSKMMWFKYNIQKSGDTYDAYRDVAYLCPKEFMDLVSANRSDATNVTTTTDPTSGLVYSIVNDQGPRWWTSFDDKFIAVDQLDTAIDVTQVFGTKTRCQFELIPTFTMSDSFVPAVDDNLFPYLLAEAKATCFVNLKQGANPKIERQSTDQRIRIQNSKYREQAAQEDQTGSTGPNYGRR